MIISIQILLQVKKNEVINSETVFSTSDIFIFQSHTLNFFQTGVLKNECNHSL